MNNEVNLINFVDLTLDEKMLVLSWRNNPDIKKWMYTTEDISIENHLSFIRSLSSKKDKLYFLIKKDNEYLGVIDFIDIELEKSAEMGIYINPELKGFGTIFMQVIVDYAFNVLKIETLFSEVFETNTRAFILYKKFGFSQNRVKTINGRTVKCMELKNENWNI